MRTDLPKSDVKRTRCEMKFIEIGMFLDAISKELETHEYSSDFIKGIMCAAYIAGKIAGENHQRRLQNS